MLSGETGKECSWTGFQSHAQTIRDRRARMNFLFSRSWSVGRKVDSHNKKRMSLWVDLQFSFKRNVADCCFSCLDLLRATDDFAKVLNWTIGSLSAVVKRLKKWLVGTRQWWAPVVGMESGEMDVPGPWSQTTGDNPAFQQGRHPCPPPHQLTTTWSQTLRWPCTSVHTSL